LLADEGVVGDWAVADLGIRALQDGFAIRAAGDEYVLHTEDDALLAEELGVVAASPRLARMVAARHRPEEPPPEPERRQVEESKLGAIAFALGGALVVAGAILLRLHGAGSLASAPAHSTDTVYQWPFIFGGTVMIAAALALAMRVAYARIGAGAILALMVIVLGFALGDIRVDGAHLMALGLIAGGVVVGVSALVGDRTAAED
jgi:peptidoglycan/LPS O-acetylase OafA/YrhL